MKFTRSFWWLVGAVAAGAALARPPMRISVIDTTLIPDARVVRLFTKSNISLVGDLYWTKMGPLAITAKMPFEGRALIQWGNFVTDLTPSNMWPYAMGGMLGPITVNGVTYNIDEAEALLKKGVKNVPTEPRLFVYLGYLQLELQHHSHDAALTLEAGSKLPNAPPFMAPLASRLLAQSGELEAAREFAAGMLENAPDDSTREVFRLRLLEIEREQRLVAIEGAISTFQTRMGRLPNSLEELVGSNLVPAYEDPLGSSVSIQDGGVVLTGGSRLKAFHPLNE